MQLSRFVLIKTYLLHFSTKLYLKYGYIEVPLCTFRGPAVCAVCI